jgi:hypothetical protein
MQGGSAIPNSSPNESFEALIDLLGSDDVVKDPRFGIHFDDGLRDTDGKLHFGKIHSLFSGGQDDGDRQAPAPFENTLARQSETGISNEQSNRRMVRLLPMHHSLAYFSHTS